MRDSKMDFWKLSIGAFSPCPWGRKPPAVTACLRRSWRTELVGKLGNGSGPVTRVTLRDLYRQQGEKIKWGRAWKQSRIFPQITVPKGTVEYFSAENPLLQISHSSVPPGCHNSPASALTKPGQLHHWSDWWATGENNSELLPLQETSNLLRKAENAKRELFLRTSVPPIPHNKPPAPLYCGQK